MKTRRLTVAQAVVEFLARQHTERDGTERRFFPGVFGIFGHGNVAGIGQALQQAGERLPFYLCRNEQAMVHTAAGYAKMANRLATLACTTSIGPGATNMLTGAAGATINRVPVLLLPGDIFATRQVAPVLQQLESAATQDISVNDAFKPVSRYWDRINRPEQLVTSLLEAMRVLTSPADTGAVTLALPEDVQSEAWDYPDELFARRVWRVRRPRPDPEAVAQAATMIRAARRPLLVAGGGVLYSEATDALRGASSRPRASPSARRRPARARSPTTIRTRWARSATTGTPGANVMAREADLVIGVGTRYSDFTTASKTAFQDPGVRFVNVNVCDFDAHKHAGLPVIGDARAALQALAESLGRLPGRFRVPRARRPLQPRVGRGGPAPLRPGPRPAPEPGGGHRRGERGRRPARRRRLRGGKPARRPAQALAYPRSQGLSPRVRLLVHGLRGGGGARGEDGRSRPRGLRHGRRRLVAHDVAGDRHRPAGGREARGRAHRQRRLRLHRRSVGVARLRRLRHPLPGARRGRTRSPVRGCGWTSPPTRAASAPT